VLDRSGEVLQRLRTDSAVRRGQWVALPDVSPALRTALVLSEDKRFYEHSGVDWRAVSAAAWGNLWNTKTRGASTISMQLAGLLDEDWRAGAGGRSIAQKVGQTVSAQVLEARWRKDQILEAYLNLVPFRGEMVGIDALSRTLFNKAAHGLDEREAAMAAALVRAPNAKAAQVSQRACGVLKIMQAPAKAIARGWICLRRPRCSARPLMRVRAWRRIWRAGCWRFARPHPKPLPKGEGVTAVERSDSALLPLPPGEGGGEGSPNSKSPSIRSTVRAPLQRFAVQTLTAATARTARPPRRRRRRRGAGQRHGRGAGLGRLVG
jgi:penicillin-binding protein 1C